MTTPPEGEHPEGLRMVEFFAEPITEIWLGTEAGIGTATEFFLPKERSRDPHVAAMLVRYEKQQRLERTIKAYRDAGIEPEWTYRGLHNGGVEISRGNWHLKSYKSSDGDPPAPGHSFARKAYWEQQYMTSLFHQDEDGGNLILNWRVGQNHSIELCLCKPLSSWDYKGIANVGWRQPVSYDPTSGLTYEPADHDEQELDVFRRDEGDAGTEEATGG